MASRTARLEMRQTSYAAHYASSVVDLHMAVTGLGLLYVAFVFTRWALALPELLWTPAYWIRFLAFLLVLLFSVFQALAYDVQLDMHRRGPARGAAGGSPAPLIAMFVADILSVGAAAAMFATVSVTPMADAIGTLIREDRSGALLRAADEFRLGAGRGIALLLLATLWSTTTVLWYRADGADRDSLRWHGTALVALVAATGAATAVAILWPAARPIVAACALGSYGVYVGVLLLHRAPQVIRAALARA